MSDPYIIEAENVEILDTHSDILALGGDVSDATLTRISQSFEKIAGWWMECECHMSQPALDKIIKGIKDAEDGSQFYIHFAI